MAISQWLKSNNYRKAEGEKCCGNCVYVVVPDLYFHKGNRCSLAWDIVSPKKVCDKFMMKSGLSND